MYAIVKTGGKQYRVAPGAEIFVEKLPGVAGDKVTLETICVVDGKDVVASAQEAAKTTVTATIVEQTRGPKQMVFKLKKRKNYKKKQGHRQDLTRLFIDEVGDEKATTKPQIKIVEPDDSEAEDAAAVQAADDAADERESEAAIEASAEAKAQDIADAPAETAEETDERNEVATDIEMTDIQYEAASDIPEDEAADSDQ